MSSRRSRSWLRTSRHCQSTPPRLLPSASLARGSSGSLATASTTPDAARQAATPLSVHQSRLKPLSASRSRIAAGCSGHSSAPRTGIASCPASTGNSDSSDNAPSLTRMLPMRPPNCSWKASAFCTSAAETAPDSTSSSPRRRALGIGREPGGVMVCIGGAWVCNGESVTTDRFTPPAAAGGSAGRFG
jgi:hypothetical protein